MDLRQLLLPGAVALGALVMATPAAAGRCGHSFPVDTPTTLAKVARACNVSLSALREANTGVDPDYVSPGEHLAVPDEIAASDVPSGGGDLGVGDSGYYTPVYQYAEYNEPAPSPRPESSYASSTSPYYYQASYTPAPALEDPNLSYQKRSASRIRNAGVSFAPMAPGALAPYQAAPRSVSISARRGQSSSMPLSPLMECAVLRRQADGKIAQVREFKPLLEGRDTPAHCEAIAMSSSGAAFARPGFETMPSLVNFTVLKGYVSQVDAECVSVRDEDGAVWRVAVDRAPMEMLGKNATIWAEFTDGSSCGGLVMDRAVYAEWAPAR
jgi:LysM repeat protein